MRYYACIIFVIASIAAIECAPTSIKQYEHVDRFVQLVHLICGEKIIDKRLDEILKDPILYEKNVPKNSARSIMQIQILICPKPRYATVNQGMTRINSKAMHFTNAPVQTTVPSTIITFSNSVVSDATTQD